MFRDAIETLKEKWTEDYKLRTGVVVGIVFLGMAAFVFSDSGKDRRDRQVFEEPESIFGISDSVEEMESYEIKGLVDELDERFTQREKEMEEKEALREKELASIKDQNIELKQDLFELTNILKAMQENGPTVVGGQTAQDGVERRPNQDQMQTQNPMSMYPNGGMPMMPPPPTVNQQIISEAPKTFGNNVIRTVTQRQVMELGTDGEIKIKDSGIVTISERDRKVRDERAAAIAEKESKVKRIADEIQNSTTLAQGSIMSAVMLNGVAAPTGVKATSEPMPVMFRVKKEALMPNYFTLDIRECHIMGMATGRLRDSRVYIRTDSISCITDDGIAYEEPLKAVAVSRGDGLLGIPGEMIFTGYDLLENTVYAGLLSGVAEVASPRQLQNINTNGAPQAIWEQQQLRTAGVAAVGSGVAKAGDTLAEYYMAMAEQVTPVIEVLPGTEVDFMITGSTTFKVGGE